MGRGRANKRYGLTLQERLSLAERIRVAFDTPPEDRVIQDTWLYAAAMAEQWYVDRENTRDTPPGGGSAR